MSTSPIKLGVGARTEERAFLIELIELYRDLTPLWQTRCKGYSDRTKRCEAYERLLDKYHERFPDATLDELKRRINTLRTNFRKEMKKVLKSGKSNHVYASRAWHFEHLMFLADQEDNISSADFVDDSMEDPDLQDQESLESPSRPKRCQSESEEGDEIEVKRPCLDEEGFYQAKIWASEVRRMSSTQQLFAKRAINNILFEGQMGNLTRNSVLTLSPDNPESLATADAPKKGATEIEKLALVKSDDHTDHPTLEDCVSSLG